MHVSADGAPTPWRSCAVPTNHVGYRTHFSSRHDAGFSVNTKQVLEVSTMASEESGKGSLLMATCTGKRAPDHHCAYFFPRRRVAEKRDIICCLFDAILEHGLKWPFLVCL
jgi:hypothetical protein